MEEIKGNNSTDQVLNQIENHVGLMNMKVVAINPTKDELVKILNIENPTNIKEPQYKDLDLQKDGILQNKIVFQLQGKLPDGKIKNSRLEFLVAPRERKNKDGNKTQIVNRLGQFSWNTEAEIEANPNMKWFQHVPYHNAMIGEEQLIDFIRNWMNLGTKDNCNIGNLLATMSGDMTELKSYMTQFPNNEATVWLDVIENNGKYYQSVYNKAFSRPTAKTPESIFAKAFNEQYGAPKTPFGGTFELHVFVPQVDTPDKSTITDGSISNDFIS